MYDVVVIGNDLSSWIAALITSRLGMETALIVDEEKPHSFSVDGYTFPLYPYPPVGFGSTQVVSKLLAELGIASNLTTEIMTTGLQVIFPRHRLDISSDKVILKNEIDRELPFSAKYKNSLLNLISRGHSLWQGLMENQPLLLINTDRHFSSYLRLGWSIFCWSCQAMEARNLLNADAVLRRIVESLWIISSHTTLGNLGGLTAAHVFSLPLKGLTYIQGGHGAFMNELRASFTAKGELITDCSVIRLKPRKEIVLDINKNGTPLVIRSRKLIVSAKWEKLNHLLLGQKPFLPLSKRLRTVKIFRYPFTLHIGVSGDCLPDKLAPYVIIVKDQEKHLWDLDNCLVLEISKEGDYGRAPRGKRALSVTAFTETSPWLINMEDLKRWAAQMLHTLGRTVPFLHTGIDYLDIEKSIALSKEYQEIVSQRYQLSKRIPAVFDIMSHKTQAKNIFLTGGMLMASLGYEGEIRSGIHAANLAMRGEDVNLEQELL